MPALRQSLDIARDRDVTAPQPTGKNASRLWTALTGTVATISGLAPHVLHHVGLLAGAALITGLAGTVLFGALGFVASVPLFVRLHRRFGTWRAPAIALIVFIALFSVSAFVIGPRISGSSSEPSSSQPTVDHSFHHAP